MAAVRAYDRVLLSGFYVVPLYYQPEQRVAHWGHRETSGKDTHIRVPNAGNMAAVQLIQGVIV